MATVDTFDTFEMDAAVLLLLFEEEEEYDNELSALIAILVLFENRRTHRAGVIPIFPQDKLYKRVLCSPRLMINYVQDWKLTTDTGQCWLISKTDHLTNGNRTETSHRSDTPLIHHELAWLTTGEDINIGALFC